jgi:hypothetical protein
MLSPFKNLLKVKKFRFILPIVFILSIGIIYSILVSMTGL